MHVIEGHAVRRLGVRRLGVRRLGVRLAVTRLGAAALAGSIALLVGAAPAAAAPNAQDRTWLVGAHQSNLAEIAAGKAAESRATDSAVKNLGQMFITDHTKLDASLKATARQLGVSLPTAPSAQQQAALQQAQQQSGRAFDSAWVASQLSGHLAAQAAGQKELAAGRDAKVLQLDRTAAPVVAKHTSELRTLANSYGLPGGVPAGTGGQAAQGGSGGGVGALGLGGVALLAVAGYGVARRRSARPRPAR